MLKFALEYLNRYNEDMKSKLKNRRHLIGRRYEDYLRNGIVIQLSPDERTWRMAFQDPRYGRLLDRRRHFRRVADKPRPIRLSVLNPQSNILLLSELQQYQD